MLYRYIACQLHTVLSFVFSNNKILAALQETVLHYGGLRGPIRTFVGYGSYATFFRSHSVKSQDDGSLVFGMLAGYIKTGLLVIIELWTCGKLKCRNKVGASCYSHVWIFVLMCTYNHINCYLVVWNKFSSLDPCWGAKRINMYSSSYCR